MQNITNGEMSKKKIFQHSLVFRQSYVQHHINAQMLGLFMDGTILNQATLKSLSHCLLLMYVSPY